MIKTTFRNKEVNVKEQLTLTESISFVKSVVNSVVDLEDGTYDPLFYDISLVGNFITTYTDILDIGIDDIYNNFEEFKMLKVAIFNKTVFNIDQYDKLVENIDKEIEFNKKQIIHKQNSAMDDMFVAVNTLLSTLNDKAKDLDTKKLEKIFKKLNPEAILKAYQKSGIGEDIRDKAIQEQVQEIKDLKNQISARNVIA
jgi:NADH:ubiquinone oxidoreductase subunit F (NADH-binding)